jgi:hypothetical protein
MIRHSVRHALAAAAIVAVTIPTTRPLAHQEAVGRIERVDARFDALIPPGTVIEKIADGIDWAEGPLWDSRNGVLLFSDIPRNGVFSVRPGSPVTLLFLIRAATRKSRSLPAASLARMP